MKAIVDNDITVLDPSPQLLQFCYKNYRMRNPEYDRRLRMGFWLGNTPSHFDLFQKKGDKLILPYGAIDDLQAYFEPIEYDIRFTRQKADYERLIKGTPTVRYAEPIQLYEYQEQAVNRMLFFGHGILQAPAGSGKTQMGIALIQRFGTRALWLCHTQDLLKQSKQRAEQYISPLLTGTITEGKVNMGEWITFATVQTMCNVDLQAYKREWDIIIVDECHRIAGSPTQMTRYYKVLNNLSAPHKYGLTATPERSDGMFTAAELLLGVVKHRVTPEAVAEKIMPVAIKAIPTNAMNTTYSLNPDGTLNYSRFINELCSDEERTKLIASQLIANKDHYCLILSDRIEHLEAIMRQMPGDMKDKAVLITGTTHKDIRDTAMNEMRSGGKQYMFATYALAKEGVDLPRLDRLFLTTPVKYHAVVVQAVGRVARTFPGKETPIVYDYVDRNIHYCQRAFKERCKHYRQLNATFV